VLALKLQNLFLMLLKFKFCKRLSLLMIISFLSLNHCKSSKVSKKKDYTKSKPIVKPSEETTLSIKIIDYAKQFQGVRYKFGGTTKKGMDCSGLVHESFSAYNIQLPRISRDMAKRGKKISLNTVIPGDLLFFKTKNKRNAINHVGLVIASSTGNIKFIHVTTSKGVIISSLSENYWNNSFAEARRIL